MKKIFTILSFIAITVGLAACTTSDKTTTDWVETVKIWVIAPVSWPAATYWEDAVNVFTDTVKKFNTTHKNIQIDLIIEDGKCEWKSSVSAIQKLINIDKVQLVLWGLCSSESVSTFQIANKNKVAMLSPTSSSPELSVEWDYFFRFWNDAHASIGLAEYLKQYKNIAFFNETTDYAQALTDKMKSLYTWNYVISEKFSSDEKDFSILSSKIKDAKEPIDAIVYLPQTEATAWLFVKAMAKDWLLEKYKWRIITAYVLSSDTFLAEIWDLADGMVEVQLVSPKDDKWNVYLEYFRNKYGIKSIDYFITLERESAELAFDAILAGKRTGKEFKEYFESINKSNKRDGYFGEYYFDKYGDAIGLKYQMQHIVDGKSVKLDR